MGTFRKRWAQAFLGGSFSPTVAQDVLAGKGQAMPLQYGHGCALLSPGGGWGAGERSSGDRRLLGWDRAPLRPLPWGLLATTRRPPQRLANLGNHPPDRSVVGSGQGPKLVARSLGSPSPGCGSAPVPARAAPCAAAVAAALRGVSWDALNTQGKWEVRRKQEILK